MRIALIFLSLSSVIAINSTVIRRSSDVDLESSSMAIFKNFIALHRKKYDEEETAKRFKIFEENLAYITSLNEQHNDTIFGVTEYTDYMREELQNIGMKLPADHNESVVLPYAEKVDSFYPTSFDWRTRGRVTPVKSQGACGSCWAFAVVAVVESMYAIRTALWVDLSEQELVDCDTTSRGCAYGYQHSAYGVARVKGLLTEQQYPYLGYKQSTCPPGYGSIFVRTIQRIDSNADRIANYVYTYGPVSVSVRITFSLLFYRRGIYRPSIYECATSRFHHIWMIVGFGELGGQKYWIIKNSWGTAWGEQGFIYYVRGENTCGIESHAYSAIV